MEYLGLLTPEQAEALGITNDVVIFAPSPKHLQKLREIKNRPSPAGQKPSNNPPASPEAPPSEK